MRYELTTSAGADIERLSASEKERFREAVRLLDEACDATAVGSIRWPKSLRVKAVQGAPGVFEMTWSFAGPDGRATWEWTDVEADGERVPAVRWRRVGGHAISRDP